jgi:hypothetical protein
MPNTSNVAVLQTATPLPTTILTRKTVIVHNQGVETIYVSTSPDNLGAGNGLGISIAGGATFTFPSGAPLWAAVAVADQTGVINDQTLVMELE